MSRAHDLPTGDAVDEFFQALEAQAALTQQGRWRLCYRGDFLVSGRTLPLPRLCLGHVARPWVRELLLASFLTPTARFQPIASFNVYSLTWTFFLHPGSCHTPNLFGCHNALYGVEQKANEDLRAMRAALRQKGAPDAVAQAQLKARLRKLADVALQLGTGSLKGIGLCMASASCEGAHFCWRLSGRRDAVSAMAVGRVRRQ